MQVTCCKLLRGRGPSGALRYLAVPRLPVQQTPNRWTGSEPLNAEQMTVLREEQIRGMLSLPSPSPSAWLDAAVSPQICSIGHWYPTWESKTAPSGSIKPAGLEKGYPVQYDRPLPPFGVDGFPVAVPPRTPYRHRSPRLLVPCAFGWAVLGLSGARRLACRWACAFR